MPAPVRRRGPRAALMVVAVAILAAVAVAALGFNTTTTVPRGVPPTADLVTVTPAPLSRPVAPGFIGLSLEFTTVEHHAGSDPAALDQVFVRLVRQLAPHGHPSLRIGGDTSDWGWFPTPQLKKPRGIRFTLNDRWLAVTRALAHATDARLILGLNLEAGSTKLVGQQVRRFATLGAQATEAYELGNEPEVFGAIGWYYRGGRPVFARRRHYDFGDYNREVGRYIALIPRSAGIAGPATGGPKWWARAGELLRAHPRIDLVTVHLYPLHECRVNPRSRYTGTIPHLMAPYASRGLAADARGPVAAAHRHGARLRVDELNSVSCGGQPGVSDRFASALWAIDTLFALAAENVDGVNFHTFAKAWYRPFGLSRDAQGRWRANVAPLMYGLLFFNRAAPPGSRVLRTGAPATKTLRVWATAGRDHRIRTTLINTSPTHSRTVAIKLPGRARRPSLQRLLAPGLSAASGITLDGQSFADPTYTAHLVGLRRTLRLRPVRPGIYVVRLPPASAALITG